MSERGASRGDLSVTALYTAQTWKWAGLPGAELFATWRGRDVFNATNFAIGAVRLVRRGLPSLKHGLVQRHLIFDHLLADSGCQQVIELAAGLSRRGATFSQDPAMHYVEVDLPHVVERKRTLLARTARGREVAERANLRLIAGDAEHLELEALLPEPGPVFVIAEGLLMYLDAEQQQRLWRRVAALVASRPGSVFAFDLVPFCEQPQPGRAGRFLQRVFERATRGSTFAFDERTRDDLAGQLEQCGFAQVRLLEPALAPPEWQLPFLDRRTQMLIFVCR